MSASRVCDSCVTAKTNTRSKNSSTMATLALPSRPRWRRSVVAELIDRSSAAAAGRNSAATGRLQAGVERTHDAFSLSPDGRGARPKDEGEGFIGFEGATHRPSPSACAPFLSHQERGRNKTARITAGRLLFNWAGTSE